MLICVRNILQNAKCVSYKRCSLYTFYGEHRAEINDSRTCERCCFSLTMAKGPLPGCCYGIIPAMTSLEWLPGARRWQKRAKRFGLLLLLELLHTLKQNQNLVPLAHRVVSFSYDLVCTCIYMYANVPHMYLIPPCK